MTGTSKRPGSWQREPGPDWEPAPASTVENHPRAWTGTYGRSKLRPYK